MISSQQLIERIQKNVGVPWQSQRSDGFSDGILAGSGDTAVAGIVTTFTPTLEVLRKAVNSGKNVVICREAPSYSRGERAPAFWRNGPAPSKELLDNDAVWRAKEEFISKNNLVIIRFVDNWDARKTDSQLRGLSRALGWDSFHVAHGSAEYAYDPHNVYFRLPITSLSGLAGEHQEEVECAWSTSHRGATRKGKQSCPDARTAPGS